MSFRFLTLSSLAFPFIALSTALAADTHDRALPEVTVTASRIAQPIDTVGSSVTIVTREEILRRGDRSVADALKRVPGVTLARNGGIGATTQVFVRGATAGRVQVLIDGIPVNDASAVDTAFDFSTMLTDDVARIEVIRGPQSSLYGSDAIGGVINIITRRDAGWNASAEVGSYRSFTESLGYNGHTGRVRYGFQAQHLKTDGFSRSTAGNEDDGSTIAQLSGHVEADLTEQLMLAVSAGYSDAEVDFDPASTTDGPGSTERRMAYGQAKVKASTLNDTLDHTVKINVNRTERDFDEPAGFFRYSSFNGQRTQANYQADWRLRDRDVLTGGLEWEEEDAENTNTTSGVTTTSLNDSVHTRSAYAQYLIGLTEDWTLTLGGRHDDHETFGSANTYRMTSAYVFPQTGTILRGSVGSGFKAPTLFQLFSSFGNPSLQAEESVGYDLGIEQSLLEDRLTLSITGFHNEFDDLITFDSATFRYANIAEAETTGIETSAGYQVSPVLRLHATHTWMLAEDSQTGKTLPRRPKHTATAGADWDITGRARIGGQWRYVDRQLDTSFSDTIFTDAYDTLDLTGQYEINERFTATARIENLLDEDYGEAAGYQAAGFSVFGGVRAKF